MTLSTEQSGRLHYWQMTLMQGMHCCSPTQIHRALPTVSVLKRQSNLIRCDTGIATGRTVLSPALISYCLPRFRARTGIQQDAATAAQRQQYLSHRSRQLPSLPIETHTTDSPAAPASIFTDPDPPPHCRRRGIHRHFTAMELELVPLIAATIPRSMCCSLHRRWIRFSPAR